MPWFPRNNIIRASELNTMASMLWKRTSRNYENLIEVRLSDPKNKHSAFIVAREGKPFLLMRTSSQVQQYIKNFYKSLLYSDGNAPNDVFLDSLNSVTTKKE